MKITEFTVCFHSSKGMEIIKPQLDTLLPLRSLYNINFVCRAITHPTSYDSYSQLINHAVSLSPTNVFILVNDRCVPSTIDYAKSINLLEQGFAAAALWNVAFLAASKELFRKIGWWDERYIGGGFEDDEFVMKLKAHDLAYYEALEIQYDMHWKTNTRPAIGSACSVSGPHFFSKWKLNDRVIEQIIADETYDKYSGLLEGTPVELEPTWRPWSESVIGVGFEYNMKYNEAGPSRTHHFRNWQHFRSDLHDIKLLG